MTAIVLPYTDLDDLKTNWGADGAGNHDVANGVFASDEIVIDADNKKFWFVSTAGGNFAAAGTGVTGQALYSLFKERWKNVPQLPQYEFPMLSITNEQFEFINGWQPDDTYTVAQSGGFNTTTRKMIRTAGWSEVSVAGTVGRRYAGVITLGTLESTDQAYYVQDSSFTATTVNTTYTGPLNEAIQIFGNNSVDATTTTFNRTSYMKLFVRTRGKTYADSDLNDIGVSTLTYIVYRFPLSSATDLNINTTDDAAFSGASIATIDGDATTITVTTDTDHGLYDGAPVKISGTTNYNGTFTIGSIVDANTFTISSTSYNFAAESAGTTKLNFVDNIGVFYLPNPSTLSGDVLIRGNYATATAYADGDVVYDVAADQWYYANGAGTSSGANVAVDASAIDWQVWTEGVRDIEEDGTKSAYTAVLDLNTAGTTPGATKEIAYEWAQWKLRQASDINSNVLSTNRNGNIADPLAFFVGPTLNTYYDTVIPFAVVIDNIADADVNNVQYNDYAGAAHFAPTVVQVTINFNTNLSGDTDSVFYAYYTTGVGAQTGNDFGSPGAIQVIKVSGGVSNTVGSDVNNEVPVGGTYSFNYAYTADGTNGRTTGAGAAPVNITIVALGLSTGQYVSTSGDITSAGASFSLVAPLERNYINPV